MTSGSNTRKNTWTKKRFAELLTNSAGAHFGISQNEEISNINIMNNTVIIEIREKKKKHPQRRGKR